MNHSCVDDCGLFGDCLTGVCVCKTGWSNTFNSQFALSPTEFLDNDVNFMSLPCLENEKISKTLYGIHSISTVVAFLLTALAIRRKSQLKRAIIPFITLTAMFSLSVYKNVQRGRENVLANDKVIGLLLTFVIPGSMLSMLLFMNKYIIFRIKLQSENEQETWLQLRILEKTTACTFMFIFLALSVLIDDVKARNALFKVGLGFNILIMCWLIFETMIQFNFLVGQLVKVRNTLLAAEKKQKLMKVLRSIQMLIVINSCLILVVLITVLIKVELFIWMFHLYLFAIYTTSVGMNVLYRMADRLNKSHKSKNKSKTSVPVATSQCEV